ncbi:MAG: glycosyltransferase [Ruminococcus sp.]|nr:glycosyltransferase [Ruminococcus sp.]
MKTILLVSGTMNFGGAETMVMDILRKLKDDFRFVFLINRNKGTKPVGMFDEEIKAMGIPMYYIDAVWDVGVKEYERQFKEVVQKIGKVDVVHSHVNSKSGIVCRCAQRCGIKRRIVHCHAKIIFDGSLKSRVVNNAELFIQRHWIKKYATDFWGCSEDAMPSLFTKKQINSEKARIIHNAINMEKFTSCDGGVLRKEYNLSKDALVIGTVGRIAKVKNYRLAADIVKELWQRNVDCYYVVAGVKQDLADAQYLFDTLSGDRRFIYIGTRNDIQNIYKDLSLYLGTSKREGLGLSVVEAQAGATPCVVSSGFPKLCDMGLNLVDFVDSADVKVWADRVERMLESKTVPQRQEIENAIRMSGFDINTETAKLREYYNYD